MDTGTTLCLIDDTSCKAIYDAIEGSYFDSNQQGYCFPSNLTAAELPDVQLALGDYLVPLQKEDLAFADAGNGMSYGGVQSAGNMGLSIFGDVVLKAMYACFDVVSAQYRSWALILGPLSTSSTTC